MAFALPAAATALAAAAPAAATAAAAKVTLMAVAKSVLMNVAISAAMSAIQPQVGSAGRTFEWTLDPNAPIPFAAGRVGVAGTVAHLETYGPDKMYYGFVSVLSGAGPIRGVTGFMGDDETVTFDGNGKAVSSQWAGEMWFRSRLGAQPDLAIPNPPGLKNNATLPAWTANHRMSGKAGYMLVLGENSKRSAYPTGEPKPIVTIDGLYGWDPRQDSTYPGGAGPCRLNDPSTWVWLDCPILWGLKWELGLWEGPVGKGAPGVDYQVGGIGTRIEGVDVPAFVAAANVAEANGWKVAAYPTTDDDKAQVLDSFLQAGGAIYAQRAGKTSCIQRAAPRASVITISAEDTAGPLEIDTAASRIDRINTIRPRFWSEAHRWQMTAIDDVTAEAYRVEDGAVRPRGIDYPFVPSATQAAQLAALQIANTREGIAGTIPLKPHCLNIYPGVAFTITEPGFLLDGLKCLCLNTEYDPMTGIVTVTFVSETDGKYPFALGQSPIPPAPQVLTPFDPTVTPPAPDDWTVVIRPPAPGGGQQPGFDLTGAVNNATAHRVLVETAPTPVGPWTQAYLGPPTAERIPLTVDANTTYYVAVSYFNRSGNQSERTVSGPYTTGNLVAGDVSPTGPNIAEQIARIDGLFETYGDTVAAEASAAAASGAADAADEARDAAVVARDVAADHREAASGSASVASAKAGEAAIAASAAFDHASDAENSAGASETSAAAALLSEAAATSSAVLAARVGIGGGVFLNAEPSFASAVSGAVPVGWADVNGGALSTIIGGQISNKGFRWVIPANTNRAINADSINTGQFKGKVGPGWYVAEFLVELESGSLQGVGGLLDVMNSSAAYIEQRKFNFYTSADNTGAVVGAGSPGKTYSFPYLFNLSNPATARFQFYLWGTWDGLEATRPAKTIIFHLGGIRRANATEIETGIARAGFPTVNARVTAEETTRASETAALGGRATSTEAMIRALPNMIRNPNASQGSRLWALGNWGASDSPTVGTHFSCSAAGDQYARPDHYIQCAPNTTYTFSFEGDGGSSPSQNLIFFEEYNAAFGVTNGFAGAANAVGIGWFVRKSVTFTTGSSSVWFRPFLLKSASANYFLVSRLMLNSGSLPVAWNDQATMQELSGRTSITESSVADAQAKLAVARIVLLAEATGGRPARFGLYSDNHGLSAAAIDAARIYFGDNTVFDDASDTIQTVWGTTRRVIAWGAPFGPDSLTEWEGPSGTALSAMTMANAQYWRSNVPPYAGGPAFSAQQLSYTLSAPSSSVTISGAGSTSTPQVTVQGVGGSGSYSYSWSLVSAQSTLNSTTNMNQNGGTAGGVGFVTFSGTVVSLGETLRATAMCLITDTVTGRSATAFVPGSITETS